jgi:hypothetical protein
VALPIFTRLCCGVKPRCMWRSWWWRRLCVLSFCLLLCYLLSYDRQLCQLSAHQDQGCTQTIASSFPGPGLTSGELVSGKSLLTRPGVWFSCTNTEALESTCRELRAGQSKWSNTCTCTSYRYRSRYVLRVQQYGRSEHNVVEAICKGSGWGETSSQKFTQIAT